MDGNPVGRAGAQRDLPAEVVAQVSEKLLPGLDRQQRRREGRVAAAALPFIGVRPDRACREGKTGRQYHPQEKTMLPDAAH